MRGTTHNGRVRKDGSVYSAKHNDRSFDTTLHRTLDPKKTPQNIVWMAIPQASDFEDCERRFYQHHFTEALDTRNATYERNRHRERVMTLDQYRTHKDHCPEETIFQIGKEGSTVDPSLLREIFEEFLSWRRKVYPQVVDLNWALHQDETTPHIHLRSVWIGHDKNGREVVSQNKALAEMGVQRPDPTRKQTRWNNRKQTYTADCRKQFLSICQSHGLQMDVEPLEHSQTGLSQVEYQYRQEESKLKTLEVPDGVLVKEKPLFGKERMYVQDPDYIRGLLLKSQDSDKLQQRVDELNTRIQYLSRELDSAQNIRESWIDAYNKLKKEYDQYKHQVKLIRDGTYLDDPDALDLYRVVSERDQYPVEIYNARLITAMIYELEQLDPARLDPDSLESVGTSFYEDIELAEEYQYNRVAGGYENEPGSS